jgi:uncharacterized membrane protein YgcG
MSEHDWFHEHMIVYGAGGLSAEECLRLERHAAECAACAQDLVRQRLYESALDRVCAPVHFAADWDDRVVERWRHGQRPRLRLSAPARWAASIAAVIMLGLLGAGVMTVAEQGWIAFPGDGLTMAVRPDRDRSYFGKVHFQAEKDANTVFVDSSNSMIEDHFEGGRSDKPNLKGAAQYAPLGFGQRLDGAGEFTTSDGVKRSTKGYRGYVNGKVHHGENYSSETHTAITGGIIGGKLQTESLEKRLDSLKELREGFDDEAKKRLDIEMRLGANVSSERELSDARLTRESNESSPHTARYADKDKETSSYARTAKGKLEAGEGKSSETATSNEIGLGSGTMASHQRPMGGAESLRIVSISGIDPVSVQQALDAIQGRVQGLKDLNDTTTASPSVAGGAPGPGSGFTPGGFGPGSFGGGGFRQGGASSGLIPGGAAPTPNATATAPPSQTAQARPGGDQKPGDPSADDATKLTTESNKVGKDVALLKPSTSYYQLRVNENNGRSNNPLLQPPGKGPPAEGREQPLGDKGQEKGKKGDDKKPASPDDPDPKQNQDQKGAAGQPKQEPPPQVAQRKIIRTGELEFEVEAFDNAVAEITRLISAIPGAFVATVNSEKLPNGKVRGSVVVRVPPEHLDKFVLDMRRDLTKAGELKSQRIGSQDITKQYTDIESRLRAARAMEERLINIIKSGKGEIKDLLAAERELGIWRTKSEEMEGEIRYYNNQVSLSTLTITAYEKEIRTAAALVVSEQVNMKIEAEDVEKALQAALTAVSDAKGRVTKSDLTQHTAGQVEAVMQFEVAPAAAPGIKDKLRTLGVVTHHDAQRLQQTENGGAAPAGEPIKSRQSDVRFHVTLYNVANIKPRLTFELQIAVPEVPAEYGKLLEAVSKAKGQIRVSQLDEKDKLNIYAQLDFDVPAAQREEIEKRLAELGDVITRNTTRAGPGETATDRKVGYRLVLKSFTSIPARETFIRQIAVTDVPGEYGALLNAVAKAKGQLRVSQLNEQDRLNIHAQLDFDVPSGEREPVEKQLAALGETLSRNTTRAAPNDVATDRKVTYRLTLKSVLSVLPRETFTLYAISLDVADSYRTLHEAIAQAKGHVRAGQLNEQDKQNVTAQLDFDVPAGEQTTIDKLLAEIGDVYSRTTNRAQPGEVATDKKVGYRLSMHSRVAPRETVALGLEVKDVDATAASLVDMVKTAGGKVTASQVVQDASGKATAFQLFDVPLAAKDELLRRFKQAGHVRAQKQTQNLQAPSGKLATAHIDVTLTNVPPIVPTDEGVWPQIRNSLGLAFRLLSVSLMFVIVGLFVVLPWALVLWIAVKLFRRVRAKPA